MLTKSEAISKLNSLGAKNTPFSFYCDFLGENWCLQEDHSKTADQSFQLEIEQEYKAYSQKPQQVSFKKDPISFDDYTTSFEQVIQQINIGNSFLTNLTFETPIETNLNIDEIYQYSIAKYKLLVPNQFVVFSPETFIKIENEHIYSYPMKGTIDADVPNAKEIILKDLKETAEHVTIVDLIRNDLSRISKQVEVIKFRFIDELETNDKKLLQVSSELKGSLDLNWKENLGSIISELLPAGSISGAPKPETVKIIRKAETYDRGFYTGICGRFDGETLDCGVMIRFIKKVGSKLVFCSGGGITSFSEAEKEYQEMVDKVYLAI